MIKQLIIRIIEMGDNFPEIMTIGGIIICISLFIMLIKGLEYFRFPNLIIPTVIGMIGIKVCYLFYIELNQYSWNWIVGLIMLIGITLSIIGCYLKQIYREN